MHACVHARFEVVNYLSVRRIDLNVQDQDAKSLLVKTLLAEQYELASKLIIRGADIDY
jgi:DNA primase catalytic subunit